MIKIILRKVDIYATISLSNNFYSTVPRVKEFLEYYIFYVSISDEDETNSNI